jgi:hypothetical protein
MPRSFLLLVALAPNLACAQSATETWLAHLAGEHVGTWETRRDGASYRETLRIVSAQESGRTTVTETFALVPDGANWRWEHTLKAGPIDRVERGSLADGRMWRQNDQGENVASVRLPTDTVYPSTRRERIREFAADTANTAPSPAFAYLDPSRLRPVVARLEPCETDRTLPADARCVALRLDARSGDEQWHLAADGRVLRVDMVFGGLPMRLEPCVHDCERSVSRPFDMIGSMAVPSPIHIQQRYAAAPLRYEIVREDGQAPAVLRTGEQSVRLEGDRAIVTVCKDCGDEVAETPESLAPYLRPNAWVRSEAPEITRLAAKAGGPDRPLAARMAKLESQVRNNMRRDADYVGYADAVEALRTGKGDCTEFAVILVALARAQGIPARMVVGMAYSRQFAGRKDSFNPHAWVQVYDGRRWVSYDAALEGFDSAHVALGIGTGEPQEVFDAFLQLRQLKIEKIESVVR